MSPSLRRAALRTAVTGTALGLIAGVVAAQVPERYSLYTTTPRTVAVKVSLAAIVESPTTVGVADSALYFNNAADMKKQLDLLKNAGVTSVRVAVPWVFIQPTSPDVYDWTQMDQMVNLAKENGFSIVATINANPVWDGIPGSGNPNDAAYAKFASTVATRYQGKIDAYEVWNEPNGVVFYNPVNPAAYTADLKVAYTAIKAADPDAMVIGGVLASTKTVAGVSMAAPEFLAGMYAAGAAGYFDALSYHPYSWGYLPFSKGAGQADAPLRQIAQLRSLMAANGDGDKKIWATEYGNATHSLIGVTEAQQAAFLKDFITAWQSVEGAGPAYIYTTRDSGTGALDAEANYGLWRTDWTAKPAAQMLADLETQLHAIADGTATELIDPTYSYNGIPSAQSFFNQVAGMIVGLVNGALTGPRIAWDLLTGAVTALTTVIGQAVQAIVSAINNVISPPKSAAVTGDGAGVTAALAAASAGAAEASSAPPSVVSETQVEAPAANVSADSDSDVDNKDPGAGTTGTAEEGGIAKRGNVSPSTQPVAEQIPAVVAPESVSTVTTGDGDTAAPETAVLTPETAAIGTPEVEPESVPEPEPESGPAVGAVPGSEAQANSGSAPDNPTPKRQQNRRANDSGASKKDGGDAG